MSEFFAIEVDSTFVELLHAPRMARAESHNNDLFIIGGFR